MTKLSIDKMVVLEFAEQRLPSQNGDFNVAAPKPSSQFEGMANLGLICPFFQALNSEFVIISMRSKGKTGYERPQTFD